MFCIFILFDTESENAFLCFCCIYVIAKNTCYLSHEKFNRSDIDNGFVELYTRLQLNSNETNKNTLLAFCHADRSIRTCNVRELIKVGYNNSNIVFS